MPGPSLRVLYLRVWPLPVELPAPAGAREFFDGAFNERAERAEVMEARRINPKHRRPSG